MVQYTKYKVGSNISGSSLVSSPGFERWEDTAEVKKLFLVSAVS